MIQTGGQQHGQLSPTDQKIQEFIQAFGSTDAAISAIKRFSTKPKTPSIYANNPVIMQVKDITRTYKIHRQKVEALRGVSLNIHTGEFVALTGASGSGKSTLLQLIGGLDQPTSGSITINGTDIQRLRDKKLSEFRNQTIGFVFQFFYLQPFLSLRTNVEVPGMFRHVPRKNRSPRAKELLERVGLSEYVDRLPKELSGGQIQRAAIARALLNEPKILLADEPTGNLDKRNSEEVIKLFQTIRKELGTTVIIVTHNPEIAAQADREIQLSDGVIV
jgi:ABC-type lipoprotein export system ATPase subunit